MNWIDWQMTSLHNNMKLPHQEILEEAKLVTKRHNVNVFLKIDNMSAVIAVRLCDAMGGKVEQLFTLDIDPRERILIWIASNATRTPLQSEIPPLEYNSD